jgi:hypothetical protein
MPKTTLKKEKRTNSYGHTDVKGSGKYVTAIRKESRKQTDKEFPTEFRALSKSRSSRQATS